MKKKEVFDIDFSYMTTLNRWLFVWGIFQAAVLKKKNVMLPTPYRVSLK